MRKLLLAVLAACLIMPAKADEGMWIPMLIGKNYEDMKKAGFKLSAEDIYSVNNSSLKDAIIQFNGGCTGEIISPQGLILTNHHCGYGNIAALSTVEKNYLDNGFYAKSFDEELPAKGANALFLQDITDVTAEVEKYIGKAKGKKLDEKLDEIYKQIKERTEKASTNIEAQIKSYFNGNQYLLLRYKRYNDVRLVATPPKSLGKYGGDTDNWMWPRHTADFSIFRVYADANGEPASYSPQNIPLQAKRHLPISIKGANEKDFAMIMGYPGRTNRYEISTGVEMAINEVNPSIVKLRDHILKIMRQYMDADKTVYLSQTSRYASIANYWKYYQGQTDQLIRNKVVDLKKSQEKAFNKWVEDNNMKAYKGLLKTYSQVYTDYKPYAKFSTYYGEGFRATTLNKIAVSAAPLIKELKKKDPNADTVAKLVDNFKKTRDAQVKSIVLKMDQDIYATMNKLIYNDIPKAQLPEGFANSIFKKGDVSNQDAMFKQHALEVYSNTMLLDNDKFEAFVKNPTLAALMADPAIDFANAFVERYEEDIKPHYEKYAEDKAYYSKQYVKALMEKNKGQLMYPDANSTMRVTYGQVLPYNPQDAVYFDYYTTIDGLMDKYKPGDYEFDLPIEFINLVNAKNWGDYADEKGQLRVNFITNNDITGGNSGSPIINGNGELIGCAFDGNWEAMSGDIAFDKRYKRTIAVDVKFILWVLEFHGKAYNLIREMEIRK